MPDDNLPSALTSVGSAPKFTPTTLIATVNQTLDYAYASVLIEGEISSFKINQGKWVFFELKDENSSVSCFMTVFQLKIPLEDGMKVVMRGTPKLTKLGKFSFTVQKIQPVGQGNIKKAFELLKAKLQKEGLFESARKRPLPSNLTKIGVISSTGAAGYADFIKILNARWGGLKIQVAHTQVQGLDAPEQIIRALQFFNERSEVDVIAIIRGGGSADDLSCFNDEGLVREIARSKIPVITGIGHEVDTSLADLAADVRASTPSNAAEMLSRDREAETAKVKTLVINVGRNLWAKLEETRRQTNAVLDVRQVLLRKLAELSEIPRSALKVRQVILGRLTELREAPRSAFKARQVIFAKIAEAQKNQDQQILRCKDNLRAKIDTYLTRISGVFKLLEALNPEKVLKQGYAILAGKISPGSVVKITTLNEVATAKIEKVKPRQ